MLLCFPDLPVKTNADRVAVKYRERDKDRQRDRQRQRVHPSRFLRATTEHSVSPVSYTHLTLPTMAVV